MGDEERMGEEEASSEDDEDKSKNSSDADLEAAIASIKASKDLPRPPYPTIPNLNVNAQMSTKLASVQTYIEKLSYNFTGVNYFDIRKHRPMGRILETAREITRQALPIKCVEAVFLAAYLTQDLREVERIPVSFKSTVDGNTYKHIVLALKYNSKWGSIGLSRRRELYYKELVYDSLGELCLEFKRSYERVFHSLKRIKVGLPLSHDVHAGEMVCWSYMTTRLSDLSAATAALAEHGRCAHRLLEQWRLECKKATSQGGRVEQKLVLKKLTEGRGARGGMRLREVRPAGSDSESGEGEAQDDEQRKITKALSSTVGPSTASSGTSGAAVAGAASAEALSKTLPLHNPTTSARPSFLAV